MIKTRIAGVSQFISWPVVFILSTPFLIIKINGRENLKNISHPFLIISNHVAFYDSFLFRLIHGVFTRKLPLRFMAVRRFKSKYLNLLATLKIIDLIYILYGVFIVEPGRGIDRNLYEAQKIIERGGNVVVYPEGSVVKDGTIRYFKTGAAVLVKRTGVKVLPISMRKGKRKYFRREFIINIGEVMEVDVEMDVKEITEKFYKRVVELYGILSD